MSSSAKSTTATTSTTTTAPPKTTTTSTLPPLHSFPSTWTAPSSCFASTNYYRVLYSDNGGLYVSNMYGTPTPVFTGNTPTGACFPPSFTINAPYLTDGSACPGGYTRACATAGSAKAGESASVSTITCCPSVTGNAFSFMCRDNQYGCHATAAAGGIVWTGVETNLGVTPATEAPVTRTPSTQEGIEAWGIKFLSVAPGSTATSIPTPGQNASDTDGQGTTILPSNQSSSGSLSGGAIAGIVVGSIAGVALLAVGAFLLYRRKKAAYGPEYHAPAPGKYPNAPAPNSTYQPSTVGSPYSGHGQMSEAYQPSEMDSTPVTTHAQPQRPPQPPVELSA